MSPLCGLQTTTSKAFEEGQLLTQCFAICIPSAKGLAVIKSVTTSNQSPQTLQSLFNGHQILHFNCNMSSHRKFPHHRASSQDTDDCYQLGLICYGRESGVTTHYFNDIHGGLIGGCGLSLIVIFKKWRVCVRLFLHRLHTLKSTFYQLQGHRKMERWLRDSGYFKLLARLHPFWACTYFNM